MRSTSASSNPASRSRSAAWSRTSPCAHGHALIPVASTPTSLRAAERDAAASPISVTSSWVAKPGHRSRALDRIAGGDPYLGPERVLPRDDVTGDVLGQALDEEHLPDHDLVDRLVEQLREARHVHALARRVEVDEAVDLGRDERVAAAVLHAHRLLHAGDAGAGEPELHLRHGGLHVNGAVVPVSLRSTRRT